MHNVYGLEGSLENNTKLEELEVCMAGFILFYVDARLFPWVLPFGSAATLRRLKINHDGFSPKEMIDYDLDILIPFRNLTEFEITWFTRAICAVILRAEFRLHSLAIALSLHQETCSPTSTLTANARDCYPRRAYQLYEI